ncbi:leucine zipper protein 2-like isoform X2 [Megalops cyprinoides]|uniref:leucine zipper protein 2-like isoform X2 n=1 Tax=Megalops cyprinoides TaxID=118141 RepID=UPI0018650182|nr:leucine zipper protein 2-like isoform X2 [Megalops cyprinoides]
MKFICAVCLLLLFPVLSHNNRQSYEGLEQKLKEVFTERAGILRQLSKTSKELDSMKGNLQSLKNGEMVPKKDVQRILELSQKQREEMKSLQAALQKQLDEATERAEKQQATINFLKTEMERKTKIIKDLQQENKSLKMKLLSGNKLCGIHAQESKKIQAQLKELRYGKKDLIFKGQQLLDLERKLKAAKEELEMAALDKESQLKALKDTAHLCFSSVLHSQSADIHGLHSTPTDMLRYSALANNSRVTYQRPHTKVGEKCFHNQTEVSSHKNRREVDLNLYDQKSQERPTVGSDIVKSREDSQKTDGGSNDKKDITGRPLKEGDN